MKLEPLMKPRSGLTLASPRPKHWHMDARHQHRKDGQACGLKCLTTGSEECHGITCSVGKKTLPSMPYLHRPTTFHICQRTTEHNCVHPVYQTKRLAGVRAAVLDNRLEGMQVKYCRLGHLRFKKTPFKRALPASA